ELGARSSPKTGTPVRSRPPSPPGSLAMSNSDVVPSTTFCYRLLALRGAGLASRVMEYFAKRDLVPERFDLRAGAESIVIDIELVGLDEGAARHIARCLANIVEVERVALTLQPAQGLRASA